jgi:hypothetical protein
MAIRGKRTRACRTDDKIYLLAITKAVGREGEADEGRSLAAGGAEGDEEGSTSITGRAHMRVFGEYRHPAAGKISDGFYDYWSCFLINAWISLRRDAISSRNSSIDLAPADSASWFSASRPMKKVASVAVTYPNTAKA